MAGPVAGKRCAGQLRYAHFVDWEAPCSYYYVEKLAADKWVIARPTCHPTEEDAPEHHRVMIGDMFKNR